MITACQSMPGAYRNAEYQKRLSHLAAGNRQSVEAATAGLGEEEEIRFLAWALQNTSASISARATAAHVLGSWPNARAARILEKAMLDETMPNEVREACATSFYRCGDIDTLVLLVRCSANTNLSVSLRGASLGMIHELIMRTHHISDPFANAVIDRGGIEKSMVVLTTNEAECELVRKSIRILGDIAATNAVPNVVRLLTNTSLEIASECMTALGEIRSETAVSALLSTLENPLLYTNAIYELGFTKSAMALPRLHELLVDPRSRGKTVIAGALGMIGSLDSEQFLLRTLKADDAELRAASALALGELGGEKTIRAFGELLIAEQDRGVIRCVALSLGRLTKPEVVDPETGAERKRKPGQGFAPPSSNLF